MLQRVVDDPMAAMPFSGRRLLSADEVAAAAVTLLTGRRLLASMPWGRATMAKASGLWPALGVVSLAGARRRGRHHQARRRQEGP